MTKSFKNSVAESGQDKYVKKLTTISHCKLFLHAQLQNRESLRDMADDVCNHEFQRELGFSSISAAELCRKHNQVDSDLLQHVFERLAGKVLTLSTSPAKRTR
ncbi:DUF4372 domain-containing protein [Paenibacillus sp. 2TAB26]|uniref:DUF4372 domain-containing protein n=1 Tax=Paenibacillus sp. 2TAB26 TaxID=3233005 RepID=UPI003F9B6A53